MKDDYSSKRLLPRKLRGFMAQCEKCGRVFAVKKIKTELIRKENISVLVELKQMHIKGGVVADARPHYVPGERMFYERHCQCRYCGHKSSVSIIRDVKRDM